MALMKEVAVITPMPGTYMRMRQAWLWRAAAISWRLSSAARMRIEPVLIDKKPPDILLKRASLPCRNEQSERFHEPTDLVGEFGRDPDQPGARRHERARQHTVGVGARMPRAAQ